MLATLAILLAFVVAVSCVGIASAAGTRLAQADLRPGVEPQRLEEEQGWAKRVSTLRVGGNPNAIGAGGRYRGAFQFSRPTWRTSPRSPGGDPIDYTYKTQAFVAVRLKMKVGTGPWPSCG